MINIVLYDTEGEVVLEHQIEAEKGGYAPSFIRYAGKVYGHAYGERETHYYNEKEILELEVSPNKIL